MLGDLKPAANSLPAKAVETVRSLLGFGKPKKESGDEKTTVSTETVGPLPKKVIMAPHLIPPIFDGSRFTQYCIIDKSLLKNEQESNFNEVKITAKAPDGPLDVTLPVKKEDFISSSLIIHR
jgi:hypothetical protein